LRGNLLVAKRRFPEGCQLFGFCNPRIAVTTVNANGELEFTACAEKAEHVDRSTFDRPAGSAAGARAASATEMDLTLAPNSRPRYEQRMNIRLSVSPTRNGPSIFDDAAGG
jgi:hypothetical protein